MLEGHLLRLRSPQAPGHAANHTQRRVRPGPLFCVSNLPPLSPIIPTEDAVFAAAPQGPGCIVSSLSPKRLGPLACPAPRQAGIGLMGKLGDACRTRATECVLAATSSAVTLVL